MGCKQNSDLVRELAIESHIITQKVERGLRLVDRGIFVSPRQTPRAYDESPFRTNNLQPGQIHISAPSIYCSVLEFLDVHKGQSFLNVGSGSGYFNTIVGFFLGETGLNHGVELHSNVVDHAIESTHIFFSQKFIVGYEWCRPEFVHGNAFLLKDISKRYDRIYVGAQVDQNHLGHFSEMLKEGGIMVLPVKLETETQFQRVKRTSEGFESVDFMNVSFAELIHPDERGYKPETPRETAGRKRKLIEDPKNPNHYSECVTEDLLALFKPRSLEMITSCAIRKQIGDALRMTHPIAIMQQGKSVRDPREVMETAIRRHRRRFRHRLWAGDNMMPMIPTMRVLDFDPVGFRVNVRPFEDDVFIAPRVYDDAGRDVQRLEERQEAAFNNGVRAAAERGNVRLGDEEEEAIAFHPELMNVLQREAEAQIEYERNRRLHLDDDSSDDDDDDEDEDDEDIRGAGAGIVHYNDVADGNDDAAVHDIDILTSDDDTMEGFEGGIHPRAPAFLAGGYDNFDMTNVIRRRRDIPETDGGTDFNEDGLLAHLHNIIRRRDHRELPDLDDEFDMHGIIPPFRMRFNIPGDPTTNERKRMSCRVCRRSTICRCYGVPSLQDTAKRIVTYRLSPSASARLTRNTKWMRRLDRMHGVNMKVKSFGEQVPSVLEEEIGPPLANGRLAIEDWIMMQKRDKIKAQLAEFEAAVRELGRIEFKQEIGDFKTEDLKALRDCVNVEKVTFRNEEDSILRFEKELVQVVSKLPLPHNGKDALKWNLYRNS